MASRPGRRLVHAWLTDADAAALAAEADSRGEPVAEVVRRAVGEYLARGAEGRVFPALDRTLAARDDRLALLMRQMVRDAVREAMGRQT